MVILGKIYSDIILGKIYSDRIMNSFRTYMISFYMYICGYFFTVCK